MPPPAPGGRDAPSDWLFGKPPAPERPEPLSLAIDAWHRAEAAFRAAHFGDAEFWAERALRLGPNDTQVRFLLGMALLRQGKPRCFAVFEALRQISDTLPAHRGLITAATLSQNAETLGGLLARLLSRFATPEDTAFPPLANDIVHRLGAPGWCAADDEGTVTVACAARPGFALDGRPVAARRLPDGRYRLPAGWRRAQSLTVLADGAPLLGSPIDLTRHRLVEGFVEAEDGGIAGWAWMPANPERAVALHVETAGGRRLPLTLLAEEPASFADRDGLTAPRRFAIGADALGGIDGLLHIKDAFGRDLTGSPLLADPWRRSAAALLRARTSRLPPHSLLPLWADMARPERPEEARPGRGTGPRGLAVILPVYRGLETTLLCLNRLLASIPRGTRVIVVDDASPEPALSQALDEVARRQRRITLLRNPRNLGFPGSVNRGMREAGGRDVVLLNSDALVPPGWLERLAEAAHAAPDIGTVAPISNEATILSYPRIDEPQPPPEADALDRIDALARKANGDALVEIPTSVGFCMYIRADCLNEVGLFREDLFGQGYGEENDFCMRARHLGWRHMAAPGIFVSHIGGQSFRAARTQLLRRNQGLLERLHPGYGALIAAHVAADPLAEARRLIDLQRWRARPRAPGPRASALLITHDEGGGVERQVKARARALLREGLTPIILKPAKDGACRVEPGLAGADIWRDGFPNLAFRLPGEMAALLRLLRAEKPRHVELHHRLGHDPSVVEIAGRLGLPMDIVVHDYAAICPRVTLVSTADRYCGEPDLDTCAACVTDLGSRLREDVPVSELRARTEREIASARRVIFPSSEVEARFRRYVPSLKGEITPWEDEPRPPGRPASARRRPRDARALRIAIIGAIGTEKGYDVILGCARDAARRALPLDFVIIGYTHDDVRLIETGKVRVTYRFAPGEAAAEIAAQAADFAFIPSIWPETWCFAVSDAWAAGLDVAVFDIGTQAERVRRAGRGWVLPLALSASALNDALMSLM